eukprot:gene32168-16703_t
MGQGRSNRSVDAFSSAGSIFAQNCGRLEDTFGPELPRSPGKDLPLPSSLPEPAQAYLYAPILLTNRYRYHSSRPHTILPLGLCLCLPASALIYRPPPASVRPCRPPATNMLSTSVASGQAKLCRMPMLKLRSVRVCAQKGFGDDGIPTVKVNNRGKASSRPGPISRKESRKQLKQQKEMTDAVASAQQAPLDMQAATTQADSRAAPPAAAAPPQQSPTQDIVETPQVVVDRMFKRMIFCAAAPVVFGLCLFPVFLFLKATDEDFPLWIVYVSQAITFGGGLLGITYGIMSTSWDPTRQGTFWGFTEFKTNLPVGLIKGSSGRTLWS